MSDASKWDTLEIEAKVTEILESAESYQPGHHFGRPTMKKAVGGAGGGASLPGRGVSPQNSPPLFSSGMVTAKGRHERLL